MISTAIFLLRTASERNELSEIYNRNINKFYSIAFSRLHNQQDAEDAIQEAFLTVANNSQVFFDIPSKKRVSYINVIIRNISCRIWNKKHKIEESRIELDDNLLDEQISTEEKILSNYSCKQILKFIDTLPEGNKTALYLKVSFGMNNAAIAKTLGISEEAAKKRVARAMRQIKQFMEDMKNE